MYRCAFAVLYSTFFVANASHARTFSDAMRVIGVIKDDEATRQKWIRILSGVFPILCVIIYLVFPSPAQLVLLSGVASEDGDDPVISYEWSQSAGPSVTLVERGSAVVSFTAPDVSEETMQSLLSVDIGQWQQEMTSIGEYFETYGERLPETLREVHQQIVNDLQEAN